MKVLFVLPNVEVGGVERVRLTLIEYLQSHGVECQLALTRRRGRLLDRAESLVRVHELSPKHILQFVPALARLIARERPTHIVTAFSDVGLLAWLAIRRSGIRPRWIHSVHNTHGHVAARPGFLGWARTRVEDRMAALCYRRADTVVAVSDGVRGEVLELFGVDGRRVCTIYNPVVPDEWFEGPVDHRDSGTLPRRIVTIGRMVPQKGYDVLLRALPNVEGDWRLDMWGDGPQQAALEAQVRALGLQERVAFRGYTSDPRAALMAADLFVMPSRHEGLPATLIEALAAACQIVAADCPHGPREILQDGALGELVPVDDAEALAGALTRTLLGRRRVDEGALRGRARQFLRSTSCGKWLALLSEC